MKRPHKIHFVASLAEWKGLHLRGHPPKIICDSELREFVEDALTHMTFKEAAEASRERFGVKRGVSMSAIHRYWQAKQKNSSKSKKSE